MDLILKTRALYKLRPNTEWTLDEHKGLNFITKGVEVPTDDEIDEAVKEIIADDLAKAKAKADALASAEAKLKALGLNADELKALLSKF